MINLLNYWNVGNVLILKNSFTRL